jgi:hypothetical protein
MNTQRAATIESRDPLTPQAAWRLWHQLNLFADALWQSYEREFLEFCIQNAEEQCSSKPLPFD